MFARGVVVAGMMLAAAVLGAGCISVPSGAVGATAWGVQGHVAAAVNVTGASATASRVPYASASSSGGANNQHASLGSASAGGVSFDAASSDAVAAFPGGVSEAHSLSVLQGLSFLGGLVRADEVRATARYSAGVATVEGAFAGLHINGMPVPEPIPANTAISAGGFSIVLKQTQVSSAGDTASIVMISITALTLATPDTGVGADVRIASAQAGGRSDLQPRASCGTFAAESSVLGAPGLDAPGARAAGGDAGGSGGSTATLISASPGVFAGPAYATAEGDGNGAPHARATTSSGGLNVLGGLVQAFGFTTVAQANGDSQGPHGTATTLFDTLVVNGQDYSSPAPNQHIGPFTVNGNSVHGWLNEQRVLLDPAAGTARVEVAAVHLQGTWNGQPVDVTIGRAVAEIDNCAPAA